MNSHALQIMVVQLTRFGPALYLVVAGTSSIVGVSCFETGAVLPAIFRRVRRHGLSMIVRGLLLIGVPRLALEYLANRGDDATLPHLPNLGLAGLTIAVAIFIVLQSFKAAIRVVTYSENISRSCGPVTTVDLRDSFEN
jgi:hypothetical protein